MSPRFTKGTKPASRWRSDPHVALRRTRTIASCALRIFGSGTSRTATWLTPSKVSALTVSQPALDATEPVEQGLRRRREYLAGFGDLLDPAEGGAQLLDGVGTAQAPQ